ncbi:MAG: aminotransferase class I/II-fold pyridoxal phosphate-dependent enzyme [Betaproteobacteria bacterium]|nr:aminotransferase class I/II-fold pyridoxal phosphate-dependent enzyme [Betaproteobacteria bacterium]
MKPITDLIHRGYQPPGDFASTQFPVHKASSVFFSDVAQLRDRQWLDRSGYTYGLHGTPSTFVLEERLCQLEGAKHAVLLPSGLAALAQVNLAFLTHGDEVLIPDNAYGPLKSLFQNEFSAWGITHQCYDPMRLDDLANRLGDKTKLVWLEAPGSVTLEFPDLVGLLTYCRHRGVLTALDNTWGAGLAFQPFDLLPGKLERLGVDISVHALTKYPSGGGDVLMGSISAVRTDLAKTLMLSHMRIGFGVSGNDVELVLRSLSSIELRYEAQDRTCREVAAWCIKQDAFAQVLHPALVDSPGHAHWRRLCAADQLADGPLHAGGRAASLLSLRFQPRISPQQVDLFCNALKLFKLGYSWGGPISLVVPYDLKSMREHADSAMLEGGFVRLAMGLEQPEDLIADLAQALQTALT